MNIAEIESSLKELVETPFDADAFIFRFLEIYDAPKATVTKLRQGTTNHAKELGGLLWKNKLFFRIAGKGQVAATLMHRFFAEARLDIEIMDRFGKPFRPREWFLLPLPVIETAIAMLLDGTILRYRYDAAKREIVPTRATRFCWLETINLRKRRVLKPR